MDNGGGSQMNHISEDKLHLLFSSSLWEVNSVFIPSASGSYFCGYVIKSHPEFVILFESTICLQWSHKSWEDKMSENKQTFRLFILCFFLFVFPPSSGLTLSQYAVSVLERKSQTGTSSQKSCCPARTVGAVVSPVICGFIRLNILSSLQNCWQSLKSKHVHMIHKVGWIL